MTARRIIEKYGKENVILLFTDTLIEDEDLYRFVDETAEKLGAPLVKESDGRSPWEIFEQERFIGNSRIANCSKFLKQKAAEKWVKKWFKEEKPMFIKKKQTKPTKEFIFWEDEAKRAELQREWEEDEREICRLYLGIDWTEDHRTVAPKFNWAPYRVDFPMCEEPYMTKEEMLEDLKNLDVVVPKLYKLGFAHNNCGGFCVRAGQGHFINLLKTMPERYKHHEEWEQKVISLCKEHHGQDKEFSILTRQRKGVKEQLTLKQLREEWEAENTKDIDLEDMGGCGCFIQEDFE